MSTEKFNEVDDLRTHYMCAEVHPERDSVFIAGSSPYEPAFLNIAAARALYEWLGDALLIKFVERNAPKESK